MAKLEKPNVRGPTASEKARKALGPELNRPSKAPPLPAGKIKNNEPPARRVSDEVHDL